MSRRSRTSRREKRNPPLDLDDPRWGKLHRKKLKVMEVYDQLPPEMRDIAKKQVVNIFRLPEGFVMLCQDGRTLGYHRELNQVVDLTKKGVKR